MSDGIFENNIVLYIIIKMSSFDEFIKSNTSFLENEYISSALLIFLILYANLAAPKLPDYIAKLFDNILFKIVVFFFIVYMHKRNATVALISSVALTISLMLLDRLKMTEKMTVLNTTQSSNSNQNNSQDLLSNLNNLIDNAFEYITSSDAQVVLQETQNAVQEGTLHPADAEMIINKIILAEQEQQSPIVAISEEGAQQMSSIAQAVQEGKIDPKQGQQMAAQIVIQENVAIVNSFEQTAQSQTQDKQILAQEVLRQKSDIENNTGTKMTQLQLRQLCAQIESDYYNQKMEEISQISGVLEFNGYDSYAPILQ